MKINFSTNLYYFHCTCLKDSVININHYHFFVNRFLRDENTPPPPPIQERPIGEQSWPQSQLPFGLQWVVMLCSSGENRGCKAFPLLSVSPLWWHCGWRRSCVMGAWLPVSSGSLQPPWEVQPSLGPGIFLSPGKGTIVGVLDRGHWLEIGSYFAPIFSTKENDFSSPVWKG